jgi:hypothetical protein
MVPTHFRAKAGATAVVLAAAFSIASCTKSAGPESTAPEGAGADETASGSVDMRRSRRSTSAALEVAASQTCGGTDAHDAHAAFPAGCATCHPCGGLLQISELTFPRGTSTAGAQVVPGDPASCTVACHFPFGGTPTSIDWDVQGPLNCTSCHFQIANGGGYLSAHALPDANPAVERSGCEACHALGAHLSGTVRIFTGEGTSIDVLPNQPANIDVACTNCHDGAGAALAGRTPPFLPGYSDPVAGDFHGARAGTGWGGTLIGYERGADPLPCKDCHDTHASANPYMFGSVVNGTPVAGGVISRAGVGAEALCERCHAGPRHQGCGSGFGYCHGSDPQPAGSACFFCHGHEGIVNFAFPSPQHTQTKPDSGCIHCHSPGWLPAPDSTPPAITNNLVQVTNVTGNSATIAWITNEKATSYVEYGVGTPGRVAGSNAFTQSHTVTLTGLSEDTSYVFRVRTVDRLRNVTLTGLGELKTASLSAPPAPTLIDRTDVAQCDPLGSVVLRWNAVVDPQGDPVQYRVVLDDSPAFDSLRADSGWIAGTTFSAIVDLGYPPVSYYWRVQARDATGGATSPWSGMDHFYGLWDPWCE